MKKIQSKKRNMSTESIHVVYYIKKQCHPLVPDPSDENSLFQMDTHDRILESMYIYSIYTEVDL